MKVTLLSYTPDALELLIFTKNTRFGFSAEGLAAIKQWPHEQKLAEWGYMQGTIKSSWEFVEYVFLLEEVTRAFTHQLVRHRIGTSFAQESLRVVDKTNFDYLVGPSLTGVRRVLYDGGMTQINKAYHQLVEAGAELQDARGILPTNIATAIVFKANLRTLAQMCAERFCVKTQGEFQDVLLAIRDAMVRVHPWTEPVLRVSCAQTGVCLYPSYPVNKCPVKKHTLNPETGTAYTGMPVMRPENLYQVWRLQRTSPDPSRRDPSDGEAT